jgi:Skp family chaperone for outer membrane proteins
MTTKALCLFVAISAVAMAAPASAKTKAGAISGITCIQAGERYYFPASDLKPAARKQLRKGQKFTFNLAGFGRLSCTAY